MNLGQLRLLLRAQFLVNARGLNKVRGQPFTIREIVDGVTAVLSGRETENGNGESAAEDVWGG